MQALVQSQEGVDWICQNQGIIGVEQRAGLGVEPWGMRWTEGEQLGLGDGSGSLREVRVKLI